MPEDAVRRNSWLCNYAICQLGKPYWYATAGEISSTDLYRDLVKPAIIRDLGEYCVYDNYMDQLNVKVHDCSGLILGALTCESVGGAPTLSSPVAHGSTSQFHYECKTKSETMDDFPYIPGTLVFKSSGDYTKSHVGIYVGDFIDLDGNTHTEEVVEAMGHQWGVTTTKIYNSKWDCWGQLSCCTVDTSKGMTFDARSASMASGSAVQLHPEATTPFVATIAPQYNPTLDYDKIKKARISAMSFFAGELFDSSHNKKIYVNPYLSNQVQQCNGAGMPYMLYVNVRAKTEIEADEECRTLYYVLAQFPPKLGIWLTLQTNNSIELNNSILEIYYKYMERWGFKSKCGFYLTPEQLAKFDWPKFQDRFSLWLISPKNVSEVDDELLQPDMFEVPD